MLEKLDRPRQCRLAHVAALSCLREIQQLGYRQEITNLVKLHDVPQHRPISRAVPVLLPGVPNANGYPATDGSMSAVGQTRTIASGFSSFAGTPKADLV